MMRRACLSLLALVTLAGASLAAPVQEAMHSVVSVLPEWPAEARRAEEPEGSGVVVIDGRTILTAAHIINKARSVRVRTLDGDIIPARLRGRDLATDIAVLEIGRQLPVIKVRREDPELGSRVCTIGNAFGLGLSLTCGIVSGLHRAGIGFNPIEDFVQTDAAVNPGASGGALVNEEGELVGLLSAIYTKRSDANIGVNFAVSTALAMDVAAALKESGRVKRVVSGLRLAAFPAGAHETGRQGAQVTAVREGYAGARSGLRPGDVILRAGTRRIRKPADFVSVMAGVKPGMVLELQVLRAGKPMILHLKA
ncbi:MAG: PDZ domain-containing protein [Alphaproteobacteria bacterium]|nr:MAG: PDZ domain-containing protein [Alphaproteobacteria bacterium]